MDMLMIVFRTSLNERVHEILKCAGSWPTPNSHRRVGLGNQDQRKGSRFMPEETA